MINGPVISPGAPKRSGLLLLAIFFFVLLLGGRFLASTLLDYEWWKEIGQLETWFSQLLYGTAPLILAAFLFAVCFFVAWRLGIHYGARRGNYRNRLNNRLILLAVIIVGYLVAESVVDSWQVVRYFGGLRIPAPGGAYIDPIFGRPLHFYFFDLPFYRTLLRAVLTAGFVSLALFWLAAHLEDLIESVPRYNIESSFNAGRFPFGGAFDTTFARAAVALILLAIGAEFYFARYSLLFEDHGQFLLGVDYLADRVVLPLQWMVIAACVAAAALVVLKRAKLAVLLVLVLPVRYLVPAILSSVYVRPNELALERPYIAHHIAATRSAYGLVNRLSETDIKAQAQIQIDYAKHKPLLENVRLWDWKAFHDTVSQIQPLRPYAYFDADVDRYQIAGSLQQILLTPREIDVQQLGEARGRWVNPHLIYTHGYGLVMAGANRITGDGLPQLLVRDAPPHASMPELKVNRPEIYYGEIEQEPVYVNTLQLEFDYPSADDRGHARYQGPGGFPISSVLTRAAAALRYGDLNILLTNYLKPDSRMMIHRRVLDRLETQAGFLDWDPDPYLVLDKQGRLIWIVDGYMASDSHPYSRELRIAGIGAVNYIRNSVKATVDAYSGETHLYVFDESDLLIKAYQKLFPKLLLPASQMPEDLRAHVRYPETQFAAQAEIYRAFHMRDPEAFYNRADLWDIARTSTQGGDERTFAKPTYVVATVPGQEKPEFLLIIPFTPTNKDNLIGLMVARSDGPNLGELIFEELGKQDIIYGPKQIEAFINQDQTISKDLTLWNQQGSEVLRGQILVLPIENSFLYVQPIYIQARDARMPQLKKVALAMGDRLAYADTYQQALAQLMDEKEGGPTGTTPAVSETAAPTAAPPAQANPAGDLLRQVRQHFSRYRELNAQGKYAEAGRELEAVQNLLSANPPSR